MLLYTLHARLTTSGCIVHQAIANGDAHTVEMMKEFLNFGFLTVGASGAVFGLLLAFGMTFPNLKMYIIPFPFPIKAKWMVIGYGVFELLCGTTGCGALCPLRRYGVWRASIVVLATKRDASQRRLV